MFSSKTWLVKDATRIGKYESRVVKANSVKVATLYTVFSISFSFAS